MRATANPAAIRKGKRRLLESCAILAGLAALGCGGPALAQVAGTGQAVTGHGLSLPTISPPGPGATIVDTTGAQTIINWTPTDTTPTGEAINFLPEGNTLTFNGTGNYTVLNRFVNGAGGSLSRQIALNGTVNSTNTAASGARGGNIWFYNGGGILIGASGVINVGSLVLTTNDIITTDGLFGPTGEIRFRGGAGSLSSITVNGAIDVNNALNAGSSYVALVAPRVVQAGNVRVDGSAAYVAAEQADIRINSGLFDINVLVGATTGNVITHTGTTTGPARQQGDTDQSRIYVVAIPKNDAVTMLVSGQIGYVDASSAQIEPDGAVRLSAGYNITNGELNAAPVNATAANITVNDTLFRGDTFVRASGDFLGQPLQQLPLLPFDPPPQQGRIFVQGNGTFIGDARASFAIGAGQAAGATGNFSVQSGGISGISRLTISGGQLAVGGALTVSANGAANSNTGDATGGIASLDVLAGGDVVAGSVTVSADGTAALGAAGNGGNGFGGSAFLDVSGTGSTLTAGTIRTTAIGLGGGLITSPTLGFADIGGAGSGGNANIAARDGGSLVATTSMNALSFGQGQTGLVQSGDGQGGVARITVAGSGTNLQSPTTLVDAEGIGGGSFSNPAIGTFSSLAGGDGRGGLASLDLGADAASTVNLGTATVSAAATGGNANGENAAGGDATGGSALALASGGGTFQFSNLTLSGAAASGSATSPSGQTASSGNASLANVRIAASGVSTIDISGNLDLIASGIAGSSENIGSGTGGFTSITADSGGSILVASQITVDGTGGSFGGGLHNAAGTGTGGEVYLTADGGTISAESYQIDARGNVVNVIGSNGATRGGYISLRAANAGLLEMTNDGTNFFDASARGGVSANGSSATGGTILMTATGGTIDLSANSILSAGGTSGGAATPGTTSPVGTGGTIQIRLLDSITGDGAIDLGSFTAEADGRTFPDTELAPGAEPDSSGHGQGGTIELTIEEGTLTAESFNLSSNGYGGNSSDSTGRGGTVTFRQTGGTSQFSDVTMGADGFGGVGQGQSGSGVGGTATIDLAGGTITAADIVATANGVGGDGFSGNDDDSANIIPGGLGGAGQGGTATITIGGSAVVDASTILANAVGTGGAGGEFFNASSFSGAPGTPGNGGGGTGGNAAVNINGGTTTTSSVIADASGIGGDGGGSFFSSSTGGITGVGVGGRGGTGQGGTATIALQQAIGTTATANSIARGTGGNGGDHNVGGGGGDGFGGLAQAIITGFSAGPLGIIVDSSAAGGTGANGRDGDGGNGGSATGGVSRVRLEGSDANATISATNFRTVGQGGAGGDAALGFGGNPPTTPAGGNGGNGTGGTVEVLVTGGTAALVPGGIVDVGVPFPASLGSGGIGGNGGNGASGGLIGGNGGNGGNGSGGGVHVVANGGLVTTSGGPIDIVVLGAAGEGGTAGGGSIGGATGLTGQTGGGLVQLESYAAGDNSGRINFGVTRIAANGDNAGRIELLTDSSIAMTSLDAQALGAAAPTNNDTDNAPAGIFLAATGGTISTTGNMTLATDSSFGAYAQSNGAISVGGDLTITAADQIDLRHDFRAGSAPTIGATGNFTATAGSISGAPGSLLDAGGTLSLTATSAALGVDRIDAVDILLTAAGAVSVEHAEAVNDFTASGASFRTGLNSIISGGDISITAPGTVDLGNSAAGGSVSVLGQSIAFNAIDAGTTVSLRAQGFGLTDGIDGNSIIAGNNVALDARTLTVDNIQTAGSLSANANNGAATLGSVDTDGNIAVFANGNVVGTFASGGNINLRSAADIAATANATGGYVDPATGQAADGFVFTDADGNLSLVASGAATMLGARAGGSVTLNGVTAGEDVFVLAGTTANLTAITAGDDLQVQAAGGITIQSSQTTGAGPDGRSVVYQACCSNPSPFLQVQTSAADLSNVTLLAPTSTIGATDVTAFDNLTANASGVVTTGGLIRSGLTTNITGSSLNLVAITAGTDIALTATTGGIASTGAIAAGHDFSMTAIGAVNVSELDAGDDIRVNTNGALTIGGAYSYGTGADNEGDGSNIVLAAGITNVEHAEADNDFIADVASFTTGLDSIITGGDIDIAAAGAVDLGNSTAGGFVQVSGQSIVFNSIDAGTTVGLNATGTAAGAEGIRGGSINAGGDINLSGNSILMTGPVTGDASLFAFASGGAVAIDDTDVAGDIFVNAVGNVTGAYVSGGNITLNSDANITASAVANGGYVGPNGISEGYVLADADGNATLTNSSAATMLGVRAGQAASVTNAAAGEDVFVTAGTTATLANITAGDDLTATAPGGITANTLLTTGAGPDNRTLFYGSSSSGAGILQITTATADGSNIALTASAGNIGGGAMNAFDNLTLAAAGAITTTGTLRSGQATSIGGRSIVFDAIDAGTTVDASATGTATGAEGIGGVGITAGGDINLNGNSIALIGLVDGGASLFATATGGIAAINQASIDGNITMSAAGNLTGTYGAGGAVRLNSDANINAGATASGTSAEGNLFVDAGGNVILANSTAGRMFGVNAGGSATITDGAAGEDMLVRTGTTASLTNVTAGDDVDIRAGGNVTANNVRATGTGADTRFLNYLPASGFTIVQGEGTSAVNGSDIIATSGGSINASGLSAGDDILLLAVGGNAQLSNATTLGLGSTAGGSNIRIEATNANLAGLDSADDVFVVASGAADVGGPVIADRNISVVANIVSLAALATPAGDPVNTLSADGNVVVTSAIAIGGGRIRALGDIALTAGAAVDVTGIFGNNVAVDGATGIAAEQLFAVGTTTLNSDNGAITLGTLVSSGNVDASADSILIDGGSMIFSNIVTDVGDAVVRGGDLFVMNGDVAGRAEFASSGERLGVDTLTAQSALLEATGGFMTLNNVTVADGLQASASTSLGINGVVSGRLVSLESASIGIASTGRVGTAGTTQNVSIANNNSENQTFIGGTGTPSGYHLDAAGLTRIFGRNIEIFAPEVQAFGGLSVGSAAAPDVIVDSFTMTGGATNSNLGANGSLTIRTPGKMRVIGNVQLTGLTDDNALNLVADRALEVILGQGSVRLVNGSAPAGRLNMVSDDIIVATPAAIADVGAATTTDAIETRLAENDGILLDEGAVFARGIRAEVVGGFYVQNSGTGTRFANRRGLTFGAGGLDVLTEGPSRIVINGVYLGPNGQETGLDTIPQLTIAGTVPAPGSFDPRSTFNGCLITGTAACTFQALEGNFPVQNVIEKKADADGNDGVGNTLPTPLITMRDLDALSGEPLLDDPVTGAGNDDLWTPALDTCDPASGGSCPAAE